MLKTFGAIFFLIILGCMHLQAQRLQLQQTDTTLEMAGKKKAVEYDVSLTFLLTGTAAADQQIDLKFSTLRPFPIQFTSEDEGEVADNGQTLTLTFAHDEFPGDGLLKPKELKRKVAIKLTSFNGPDSTLDVALTASNHAGGAVLLACNTCNYVLHLVKVKDISAAAATSKSLWDVTDIYYLNAYNFNFGSNLQSNYVGRLNVFIHNIGKSKFGLNFGFTSINYSVGNTDSLNAYFLQKVLLDPLADSVYAGRKYLNQFNRYTTKIQNNSFSIYCQPLFAVIDNPRSKVYLHAHLEVLVNRLTLTTSINSIKIDSVTVPSTILADSSFYRYLPASYAYSNTYINLYEGLGSTVWLRPLDSVTIFLQGTIGVTNSNPNLSTVNGTLITTPNPPFPAPSSPYIGRTARVTSFQLPTKAGWFYYASGYAVYNVTKAIQGLIGAEIRALVGYQPFYAVYVGVNLNLQSLFSALK